jgi:alpha-1,6-mannosyltransferase
VSDRFGHSVENGSGDKLRRYLRWGLTGTILVGLHLVLLRLSDAFEYGSPMKDRPIPALVGIEVFAGGFYLLIVRGLRRVPFSKKMLAWVVAVGAAMRILMLPSTPMLEDDYYRYLWDGAVLANGFNPYAHSPDDVARDGTRSDTVPDGLRQLGSESGVVIERVNYSHLRTIYPPVAQAAFAMAHWLKPWSLAAWRVVLLAFDVASVVLILCILRALKLPLLLVAVYWWNPLLVKEVLNSSHMDVVVLPFVLAALLMAIRNRAIWAGGFLGLAVGVKLWPVILLPIILRPALRNPKKLVPALLLFSVLVAGIVVPAFASGFDSGGGFAAYARHWEMNDALFMLFLWAAEFALRVFRISAGYGQSAARILVAAVLFVLVLLASRKRVMGAQDLAGRCLFAVTALFLLSPTQFPWYYLWVLPFLVVEPRFSLMLLTALLPLYYLRFFFDARGLVGVFDYGVVWLEFVPVWCLLIWEWHVRRKRRVAVEA